jgi:hypothetical protein
MYSRVIYILVQETYLKSLLQVCQNCNCIRSEGPILRLALHVRLLHHFLDGPDSGSSVADRCAEGVYRCLRYLGVPRMVLERLHGMAVIRRSKGDWEAWEAWEQLKNAKHEDFSLACVTCASILLRHAAYSHLLVSLLVRQITDYAIQYPLFDLEASFIPYLQVSQLCGI